MTPRQQEIALKLMAIYEECHVDCEADRLQSMEDDDRLVMPRCEVCSLISEYYAAQNTDNIKSSEGVS